MKFLAGIIVALLANTVLVGSGFSQDIPRYTLDDCLASGLRDSGKALNARRDEQIAATQIKQARAEALPHLSVNAGYTRLDELQAIELDGQSMEMGTIDNYSADLKLSQTLYSGRVGAALRAAKYAGSYAEQMRQEKENELTLDIRRQFYDVLLARETAEVISENIQQMQALLKQTEDRQAQGVASDFEVLAARVRVENGKPELLRATNRLLLGKARLRVLAGLPDRSFEVDGELRSDPVEVSIEDLETIAMGQRPLFSATESMVALRRENVEAVRSAMLPGISAFALYNGANSYRFVSFGEDEWEWHWSAGLSFQWNVWDGDLSRQKLHEARLEREKAKTDADEMRKNMLLAVREASLELLHAEEELKAVRENVTLAEKALDIAGTRYKAGLTTQLEYADSTLELRKAKLGYAGALYGHMKAVAQLEYVCGLPIERMRKGRVNE